MKKVRTARLMIKLLVAFVAGGAVLLGSAPDSQAAFKLRLIQGSTTLTITDNCDSLIDPDCDVSDGVATDDWIDFDGAVGTFDVVATTGLTDTTLVDPLIMDLNSIQSSTETGGILTIMLTSTDFSDTSSFANFLVSIGGTKTNAVISYEVYIDTDNAEFQTNDSLASVTKIADISEIINPFSSFETGFADVDGAYSITMLVTVVCDAKCSSSFNATVEIPEPATLALFGMGLLMLGAVARRPRKSGPTRGA